MWVGAGFYCDLKARILNVSCCLFQNPQSTLFTIDRHSGVVRIKAGEMLDYEKTKTHFVTIIARVITEALSCLSKDWSVCKDFKDTEPRIKYLPFLTILFCLGLVGMWINTVCVCVCDFSSRMVVVIITAKSSSYHPCRPWPLTLLMHRTPRRFLLGRRILDTCMKSQCR